MILDMPNIKFSDEEWIYLLIQYLDGWTEIPLNPSAGYDIDKLKFYDGFIGLLLKQTEEYYKEYNYLLDMHFVNSWTYTGKLYRIIHPCLVEDDTAIDGYSLKMPQVEYHRMISHWTDDYTFKGLMHKLYSNKRYIILEADTQNHFGFDVNRFRQTYNCEKPFTSGEREIIFPMYRECIKERQMSVNQFIQLKERQKLKKSH